MFKGVTYKKKFFAVVALFTILSITAYKRSFKMAFETVSFYTESKNNIEDNSNIHTNVTLLKNEINSLDQIIGKKAKNPEIVQNNILNFLSQQEINITLSKIENIHISSDSYFTVYSNIVSLNGSFNELLKTIYIFEKDFEYARIASLKFYVVRNRRTKTKELYNDIIFQNYENKN